MLRTLIFSLALGASVAAAAEVPQVGQSAPGFSLPSQEGSTVSLKQFQGKWVVLYFTLRT